MRRFPNPLLPVGPAGPCPIRLPSHAADIVRDALARAPHGGAVVVFRSGEVAVEDRDELVATYRYAGIRELYQRLRDAVVPLGHALGLVDLEAGARVVVLPIAALCGDIPTEAGPVWSAA